VIAAFAFVGLLAWFYQLQTFLLSLRGLKRSAPNRSADLPAISILKPVSGLEKELEMNLTSFFRLDYPDFELLFCSTDANDPALAVVRRLQARFPHVKVRVIAEGLALGANPKINTVGKAFEEAAHDWILISDANVRAAPDFLRTLADGIADGSDMQSGVLKGTKIGNRAGRVEALFYELFFSKAMWLSEAVGTPCASAKCLFFRRSDTKDFGGLKAIADYHADDVRLGRLMVASGRHVSLIESPVPVYIGAPSWASVWSRQVRWGRNRRILFLKGFVLEPFLSPLLAGALLALALSRITGVAAAPLFLAHLALWATTDFVLLSKQAVPLTLATAVDWILMEFFRLLFWFGSAFGRSVEWRGKQYHLAPGGKMIPQKARAL
jgi:ceramide glucosyltransferase